MKKLSLFHCPTRGLLSVPVVQCSVVQCSVVQLFSCDNVMFQAESRFGGRVNSLPYNDSVLG